MYRFLSERFSQVNPDPDLNPNLNPATIFQLMRLIDRYLLFEWLKTFSIAALALISILIVEDVQDDLSDYINWGASPVDILEYYFWLLPSFFPLVIPLSLFVSLLFMLGNLHRNNEIVALRAAGISLVSITRILWVAGLLLSLGLLLLNGSLVPRSVEIARTLRDNWRFSMEEKLYNNADRAGLVYTIGFNNHKEGRLWLMNRFSQRANEGFGINIYERDSAGSEVRRIMAKDGYYDETVGYWILNQGREVFSDPDQGGVYFSPVFERKEFPELTEVPNLMLTLAKRTKDLSLFEIRMLLKNISAEDDPRMNAYAVRYQNILALPFTCLIIVGIAIPFSVSGVRTNPMIGVSKAAGLLVGYFAVLNISRLMGEQQLIGAFLAAWIPIVLMLGVSLYLFRKVA